MSTRDEIAEKALALSPDDRAFLADLLELSLIDADPASSKLAVAWTKEIDRRLDAYDRGETDALDSRAAMDEMRRALAQRQAGKGK